MNTNFLRTLIITGAATLISLTSNAQRDGGDKKPPSPEKIIEKFDTDKDGKISKTEVEKDKKGHLKENFDKIDSNNDEYLNKEELQAFIDERKKPRNR